MITSTGVHAPMFQLLGYTALCDVPTINLSNNVHTSPLYIRPDMAYTC